MSAAKPSPDRRAVLGGSLVLASAVAATAAIAAPIAIAAASPPGNLDAVLIDLGSQLAAAVQRQQQHDRDSDAAYERYQAPTIPDALFHRPEDRRNICVRLDRLSAVKVGDGYRRWYEDGEADLSRTARRFLAGDEDYKLDFFPFTEAHQARSREIVAAHEAWTVAVQQAEDAAGITAANDGGKREEQTIIELRLRIARTPAATADGIRVKAHAATLSLSDDLAWIATKYLPELLAVDADKTGHAVLYEMLAISLIVDILALNVPAVAVEAA